MPSGQKNTLSEHDSKLLLKRYGIPVVRELPASDVEQAAAAADMIGYPVVLKGHGARLPHKTERGLVRLNLLEPRALKQAADAIARAAGKDLEGFLVQPQVQGQREFVAGAYRDAVFGPVVMFGLGGTLTEAISDITFRLAPATESDALDMLGELKSRGLLNKFRGEAAVKKGQLVRVITALSRLAADQSDIQEIDINPLKLTPAGDVVALDALVVKTPKSSRPAAPVNIDPDALGKFFHPRSIAFVGASAQIGKWGHMLFAITAAGGYKGLVYLVNPKGGQIAGRKVYRSVLEIPGNVDLAVVTIPAHRVIDLVCQFKEKHIPNMLLVTSGYSETGQNGRKLEKALVKAARRSGILMVGPNTMGICNPHIRLYCTGSHVRPRAGSTAVVAQSGNMGTQLLAFAERQGIGIRAFCGSGNEAMVTIEDYLDAFEADPRTRTVMLYVESVKHGPRFFNSARRVGRQKPIVLLKGGRTPAGHRAARSHTGAMASDFRIFDAVCRQAGIVRAERPMDLLDLSAAFSSLPLPRGNRAAIMTLGGGWGVVTADLCADYRIEVPKLPVEIVQRFDKILPSFWSRANPVDIVGERDNTVPMVVIEELLKWDGCDAVINLGILGRRILLERMIESVRKADPTYSRRFLDEAGQTFVEFEKKYIRHIVRLMEKFGKPVFGVSMLTDKKEQTVYRVPDSRYKGVFYATPERAVKAFAKMVAYRRFLSRA